MSTNRDDKGKTLQMHNFSGEHKVFQNCKRENDLLGNCCEDEYAHDTIKGKVSTLIIITHTHTHPIPSTHTQMKTRNESHNGKLCTFWWVLIKSLQISASFVAELCVDNKRYGIEAQIQCANVAPFVIKLVTNKIMISFKMKLINFRNLLLFFQRWFRFYPIELHCTLR